MSGFNADDHIDLLDVAFGAGTTASYVENQASQERFWLTSIRRQNSISLLAVFPDNDDCAVANGKPGAEQFGHFLGERRGKGMVPLVTGSPTLMSNCQLYLVERVFKNEKSCDRKEPRIYETKPIRR